MLLFSEWVLTTLNDFSHTFFAITWNHFERAQQDALRYNYMIVFFATGRMHFELIQKV